jgi:hypothetical protein
MKWVYERSQEVEIPRPKGETFGGLAFKVVKQSDAPDQDAVTILPFPGAVPPQTIVIRLTRKRPLARPVLLRLIPPSDKEIVWLPFQGSGYVNGRVPETLIDFINWWNHLGVTPHPAAQVATIRNTCTLRSTLFSKCEVLDVGELKDDTRSLSTRAWYKWFSHDPTVELSGVDPMFGEIDFVVLQYFTIALSQRNVISALGVRPGDFSLSFPDLNRAIYGAGNLDLDGLSRYLQANVSTSEVFEAFGLKIPSQQVTTWGTLVVLCIQLYLYMYLRGLKNPLEPSDKAWDVGWFAVNDALLPRSIFFITVFLLPVITVFMLTKHFVDQRTGNGAYDWLSQRYAFPQRYGMSRLRVFLALSPEVLVVILPFCISVVLGYLSWRNRPRVGREAATSRRQLFE